MSSSLSTHRAARRRSPARRRRTLGLIGLALAGLGLGATAANADGGTLDLRVGDRTGFASGTTTDGAIVEYIGDQNQSFGSSGTGNFDSFVRLQGSPEERGYNTDANGQGKEFQTKAGQWTHSMKVSEIPVITVDGQPYWELWADINDSNSDPEITLGDVEIFFTADPALTGYDFGANATKVYDFDGDVLINDVNQGSGRGDLRYLVPVQPITLPANCGYGNAACATYFVLYSNWTGSGEGSADSGFEEWKVKSYPYLSVSTTAATSYDRDYDWTIEKSSSVDEIDLFDGQTGSTTWTVDVTKSDPQDSNFRVSGTITLANPSTMAASVTSVSDVLSVDGPVSVDCGGSFPFTINAGASRVCTYTSSVAAATDQTNTATATIAGGIDFSGSAAVDFGDPTTVTDDEIDVTDPGFGPWNFDETDSVSFDEEFTCGEDEGEHTNTATITQTGDSDDASVTVNCHQLGVTKTADASYEQTVPWTIDKSASPTVIDLFDGQDGSTTWTVSVTKGDPTNHDAAISGTITVTNPAPIDAEDVAVADELTIDGSDPAAIAVDCDPNTPGDQATVDIAAGGEAVCSYSVDRGSDITGGSNTATATLAGVDYSDDAAVDFGDPTTIHDDSINVSDTNGGAWPFDSTDSVSYDEEFTCGEDEGDHLNVATIDETGQEAEDTVTVNCHQLSVEKTANTSYTRTYAWDIEKSRVIKDGENDSDGDPGTLTLDVGQAYDANYVVTVTNTGSTDSEAGITGTITVTNPAPIAAVGVAVSDELEIGGDTIPVDVDCDDVAPGNQATVDIAAEDDAVCTYTQDRGADITDGTNTATATLAGVDYDDDAAVDFGDPTTEVDECIEVTDDRTTPGDPSDDVLLDAELCVDELDAEGKKSYDLSTQIGPFSSCGPRTVTNTAAFEANDTGADGSDSYPVAVDVVCAPDTCTLTQGYWKTHNDTFWGGAPTDETWQLIGPAAEGTTFFLSGQTWFQAMWTSPAGNAYYQLARQYAAATLNGLNGADTAVVDAALAQAKALFQQYTPAQVAALKGKNGNALRSQFVTLAGTLAAYNEGTTGPGHCDEDQNSKP